MSSEKITMHMVAKEAGVSIGTVSKVLHSVRCNPVLESRVQAAVSRLGYHPDPYASALRSRRTRCLGVLIDHRFCNSTLWSGALQLQLIYSASRNNYHLHIEIVNEEAPGSWHFGDFPQRIDGLILLGTFSPEYLDKIDRSFPMPLISYGPDFPLSRVTMIKQSSGSAYTQLFEHLLCQGHRRISCLMTGNNSSRAKIRAIEQAHEPFREQCELNVVKTAHLEDDSRTGYELTETALRDFPGTTALIYMADTLALGGTSLLGRKQLRIPRDISIVSHDDTPWAQQFIPPITSISYDLQELADEIVNLLRNTIETNTCLQPRILQLKLIRRDSTGPVPEPDR